MTRRLNFRTDCEANRMAFDAEITASRELGLYEKAELSAEEVKALLRLARTRARVLWLIRADPRPKLFTILHAVKQSVFFNQEGRAIELDEKWFSKNPDRHFRMRKPFPHEALYLPEFNTTIYRASTVVIKGGLDEDTLHLAIPCLSRRGYLMDSSEDDSLCQIVDCSAAAIWH
jgi:hypothetical protein